MDKVWIEEKRKLSSTTESRVKFADEFFLRLFENRFRIFMEVTTSSFFLSPRWFSFSFFPFTRGNSWAIYLLCLPFLVAVSSPPCNLDKYPFCRRCKCTRHDRKKNELSQWRDARISRNYSWIANFRSFQCLLIICCGKKRSLSTFIVPFYKNKQPTISRKESSFSKVILK